MATVSARDKTFDKRTTVSCVGRGLFRFSNANTRFNQEIPQPLAAGHGQQEYTLVTLKGTLGGAAGDDMSITAEVSYVFTELSYSMETTTQVYTSQVCLDEGTYRRDIKDMPFRDFINSEANINDQCDVHDRLQAFLVKHKDLHPGAWWLWDFLTDPERN